MNRRLRLLALALCSLFSNTSSFAQSAAPRASAPRPVVSVGHAQGILRAVVSPDGKRLFTMDADQLRAWDVASQKEIKLLRSYGGNTGNRHPAHWNLTFVEEKRWLVVARDGDLRIFNYETLEESTPGNTRDAHAFLWDRQARKGYFAGKGWQATFGFGDVAANASAEAVIQGGVSMVHRNAPTNGLVRNVVPLSGGRFLLDTNCGYAVVDPRDWSVSHPSLQPQKHTVLHIMDRPLPTYRFEQMSEDRTFHAGPDGSVISVSWPHNQGITVEKLSGVDLSVLASATHQLANLETMRFAGLGAYDAETKTLWFTGTKQLYALDAGTLALRETIPVQSVLIGDFIAGFQRIPGSENWILADDRGAQIFNLKNRRGIARFGDKVLGTTRLATSPSGFDFIASNAATIAKRVRFTPGGVEVQETLRDVDSAAYEPNGPYIAHTGNSSTEIFLSERTAWTKVDFKLPARSPGMIAYSDDGTLLLSHGSAGFSVTSMQSGEVLVQDSLSNTYFGSGKNLAALSPDNRYGVAYHGSRKIIGYDLAGKKRAWEQTLEEPRDLFFFVASDTFACVSASDIEFRSAETGDVIFTTKLAEVSLHQVSAISKDRKLIAAGNRIFDTDTGELVFKLPIDGAIADVEFFASSRFLLTAGVDNLLRLWDLKEKRELCTLALFEGSADWVASTADLRFDASEKAIDKMYVVNGAEILPLESLFDKLYTPKLLNSLLAGQTLEPPDVVIADLAPAPTVRLTLADATRNLVVEDDLAENTIDRELAGLRAVATAGRSTIAEIRIFQNGKLVSTKQGAGSAHSEVMDSTLVPGENVFRAVAVNAEGTESRPAELTVTYRQKPSALPVAGSSDARPGGGLQLHLLVVGVNTYKNPKYNLNYAVADATAVRDQIQSQTKAIFSNVDVRIILNENAQKDGIVNAFKAIAANAGPRDAFIFYYAGHGVMTSDAKPEFFLVPHDVTQLYGADDALRQRGLSSAELLELSKVMPAQKQLFILDACQSAGALQTVAMRGAAEEKAIAQLARSTGTHWLTASGSDQFATEFATLGHGAFTYALIEGLNGRADTGDGRVTVNELKAFLESEVPEITQKHRGTPQYPSTYGFGQDFPVAVLNP